MKGVRFIICLLTCALLFSACDGILPQRIGDGNDRQEHQEKRKKQTTKISFKLITGDSWVGGESYKGLIVLSGGEYVEFDDEEDYNDLAPIAIMACLIAEQMYDNGYSRQQIEHYLPKVRHLPIRNEIADTEVKEIFNKVYYDNQDKEVYFTEKKYGYREFPYGEAHEDWMTEWIGENMFGSYGAGYGRNSIIIERASREEFLKDCNGIPSSTIFIKSGWFIE